MAAGGGVQNSVASRTGERSRTVSFAKPSRRANGPVPNSAANEGARRRRGDRRSGKSSAARNAYDGILSRVQGNALQTTLRASRAQARSTRRFTACSRRHGCVGGWDLRRSVAGRVARGIFIFLTRAVRIFLVRSHGDRNRYDKRWAEREKTPIITSVLPAHLLATVMDCYFRISLRRSCFITVIEVPATGPTGPATGSVFAASPSCRRS